MSDSEGSISVEQRGHILLIGLNRPAKYNGYTPTMAKQLVEAFTRLDESNELFVGVLFGHGDHFTAGLDLPKWTERMQQESRVRRVPRRRLTPWHWAAPVANPLLRRCRALPLRLGSRLRWPAIS